MISTNYEILSVQVTFPDLESGKVCANTLISEKLIACCNITTSVSIYVWKDELIEENEVILTLKSMKQLWADIEDRIKEIHSYEIPAITSTKVITTKEYHDWVSDSVRKS